MPESSARASRDQHSNAIDANSCIVVLASGTRQETGKPYYAYLAMRPSRFADYMDAHLNKKPVKLEDFGVILHWDDGASPSNTVRQRMTEQYGIDDNWETTATDLLMQEVENEEELLRLFQDATGQSDT